MVWNSWTDYFLWIFDDCSLIAVDDTGKVFEILNVPMTLQFIIAILAIIVITIIFVKSTKIFAIKDFGSTKVNRIKWSLSLMLFPLLISIVLITLLQFPILHVISILATSCAPFSIMAVFGTFIGNKEKIGRDLNGKSIKKYVSIPLISLFVLAVIFNRILVHGI